MKKVLLPMFVAVLLAGCSSDSLPLDGLPNPTSNQSSKSSGQSNNKDTFFIKVGEKMSLTGHIQHDFDDVYEIEIVGKDGVVTWQSVGDLGESKLTVKEVNNLKVPYIERLSDVPEPFDLKPNLVLYIAPDTPIDAGSVPVDKDQKVNSQIVH